mgnify:CR=1 FL=1
MSSEASEHPTHTVALCFLGRAEQLIRAEQDCLLSGSVQVVTQALDAMGQPASEVSLVLCGDAFIHPLNRDHRNKDRPTDVLAFAQREGEFAFLDDHLLGDVIISLETAQRQADERGHSLLLELEILLVHGTLHLLGYDHVEDDDAEIMEAEEGRVREQIAVDWGMEVRYL